MVDTLYLDGCSFTYGVGLDPKNRLEHLFANTGGYQVINNARPGKSNLAIALDVFQNAKDCDVIVVGWTFSARFYLKINDVDLDFMPNKGTLDIPHIVDAKLLSTAYDNFHKYFYTMYQEPFTDELSDMLVNTVYRWCQQQNKKVIFFTWENRNTDFEIYRPYAPPEYRLPDKHLNSLGTRHLFDTLQQKIYEQQR